MASGSPAKPWERRNGESSTLTSSSSLRAARESAPPIPARDGFDSREDSYGGYGRGGYGSSYGAGYASSYGGGYGSGYGGGYGSGYGSSYGSAYGGYGSSYGGLGGYDSSYGGYGSRYGGLTSRYGSSYGTGYGGYGGTLGYGGMGGYGRYGGIGGYGGLGGYGGMGGIGGMGDPADEWGLAPNDEFSSALDKGHKWMMDLQWLVEGFGRFTRLLDFNFDAMYGSFTNIVRVVESFTLLRREIAYGFQALAIFSLIRHYSQSIANFFRRLMGRPIIPAETALGDGMENEWTGPGQGLRSGHPGMEVPQRKGLPKAVIVFFAILLGGPLLITALLKLVRSSGTQRQSPRALARALHDFPGEKPGDLPFHAGDLIEVLDRHSEMWLRGRLHGTETVGMFPKSFVRRVKNEFEKIEDVVSEDRTRSSRDLGRPPSRFQQQSVYSDAGRRRAGDMYNGGSRFRIDDLESEWDGRGEPFR